MSNPNVADGVREIDWGNWWAEIAKTLRWPPEWINQLTREHLFALAGNIDDGKISGKSWDDKDFTNAIEEWRRRETREYALREAEAEVSEYISSSRGTRRS